MQGLPPLRYLRKTTIVFLAVFLCFLGRRIYIAMNADDGTVDITQSIDKPEYSVVCRNIIGGSPFGIDSVFPSRSRLYYYSMMPKLGWEAPQRQMMHIWFYGADTVQKVLCTPVDDACESSISPELLHAGDWSVDFVEGRNLLASRQFKVEAARN
ncbi:MAG: hypothetical protein M0P13_06530 [Fibrobacteraceae bacterium]|nr:hypothetical protein [Fibrobacteraceae bacterium]